MTISFACACGQRLSARDEYVGQQVRCAVCGRSNIVPPTSQAGPASARASAGKSGFPWVLVGVVAGLLLLLGGGAAVWLATRTKEIESDLELIPANANTFVSLRLADTLERPAGKEFQDRLRAENKSWRSDFERQTGLTPEQIERATAVWPTTDNELGWGVVLTREPYDREKVLSAFCPANTTAHHAGRAYRVDRVKNAAAYPAGPRVLVVGNERGVQRCLELIGKMPREGPLKEQLDKLNDPQWQLVAASASAPPAPGPGGKQAFSSVQRGNLTGKVNNTVDLEGQLHHKDEDGARSTATALTTLQKGGPLLALLGVQVPPPLKPLLQKIKTRQDGATLNLSAQLTPEECMELFQFLGGPMTTVPGR